MNLLEPWVLLRLAAGLVACLLFARGAMTAQKVLRHFDVKRATEGQLALEKQIELGATFVRIAAVVQVMALALSVLGADRMSRGVRGAMCAYGVFGANEWGFRSLAVTGAVALLAGVLAQVYAFDTRVRALDLARPLAFMTLAMFPLVFGWRALSDHYAIPPIERAARSTQPVLDVDEEAWHRDRDQRQREITGWVVLTHPWLEWLWSHVNYHEVHHKYPWLSHRYLKPVFEATRATQPYLVVNGYWRSFWNLRHRSYYGTRADMRRFLSTPDW